MEDEDKNSKSIGSDTVGVEQSGGEQHRKQSPSGALFSSRVSPYRKQYRGRRCGRFKGFPSRKAGGFYAGGGGRTERRWKHRKQSPSGALFSSRVSPYRKQYRGRSRGRFKGFPSRKAGGFLLVVGVEQSGGEQHRTSATAVVNTHNPLLSTEYRDAAKHKVQLSLDLCDLEHFPPSGHRAGDRDVQFAG